MEWLELHDGGWRIAWRELHEPAVRVQQITRSATSMAVLFSDGWSENAWWWDLPSVMLRGRSTVESNDTTCLLAGGQLGTIERRHGAETPYETPFATSWQSGLGHALIAHAARPVNDRCQLQAVGAGYAVVEAADSHAEVRLHSDLESAEVASIAMEADDWVNVRTVGALTTVLHPGGRVVVIDSESRELVASFLTRL